MFGINNNSEIEIVEPPPKGGGLLQTLKNFKIIIEERKQYKDKITICEWCGMTYPKGGWTYYKILVRNMSIEKVVENIEKGIKDDDFESHVICSDCYDRLKICKEC